MTVKKVAKAAALRGMYFDGERGYSAFYCILTPDGYYRADTLGGIYRRVIQYRKECYRVAFRK